MDDPIHTLLRRLHEHNLDTTALTGSLATKLQLGVTFHRKINDIDLVVASLIDIPPTLPREFLCTHIHPDAGAGRLIAQFADPLTNTKIDIFRERGTALTRIERCVADGCEIRALSVEDLAANVARLLLDLGRGSDVSRKYAADFHNLGKIVDRDLAELVWPEYRRSDDPRTYAGAARQTYRHLKQRPHQLVAPHYNQDHDAVCPACRDTALFHPAPPAEVYDALGYV